MREMTKLIHWPVDRLAPKGGPSGYLFGLKHGLEQNDVRDFEFLPPVGKSIESNRTLQRVIPQRIKDLRRLHRLEMLPSRTVSAPVPYGNYSVIHFHSTEDLYLHRKGLSSYKGKVVLSSHSPCAYHKELIARLNEKDVCKRKPQLERLGVIDEYSFMRADWIIFPCPEAEEPYFHTWERYGEIRDASKIVYCPTGTRKCSARESRQEVRRRFGIPNHAFVISYVGRHNEIKGYSDLVGAAPHILENDNVWFLIAGKEEPLKGLDHPRWIEVGWTDDPHSIVSAADIFILPNKETYFDLVLLEVLSLGQIVIAKNTGGNRYFSQFELEGIRLYDSDLDLIKHVDWLCKQSPSDQAKWRRENQALFEAHFTCRAFAERYARLMSHIERNERR